jgi:hypothetical protein
MFERIILAAITTLCIYLFLQLGEKQPQPVFFGGNFSNPPHFIYNIPFFSR